MVNDRVGDFIIRLKNAARAGKREVIIPHSQHLEAIAKKLTELGFLEEAKTEGEANKRLVVVLAYEKSGAPRLRDVKRASAPGRRLYAKARSVHSVAGGTGARILSTSKGVLSDAQARKNHVGGEELFEVW